MRIRTLLAASLILCPPAAASCGLIGQSVFPCANDFPGTPCDFWTEFKEVSDSAVEFVFAQSAPDEDSRSVEVDFTENEIAITEAASDVDDDQTFDTYLIQGREWTITIADFDRDCILGAEYVLNERGFDPAAVSIGVDGDDVVIELGQTATWLFGSPGSVSFTSTLRLEFADPCVADLDLSGEVDADDLGELLSSWGPCVDCPTDFDNDAAVGGTDLFKLLSEWGVCPCQCDAG